MYEAVAVLRVFIFDYEFAPLDTYVSSNTDSRNSNPLKSSTNGIIINPSDNDNSFHFPSVATAAVKMFERLTTVVSEVRSDPDTVVVIPPESVMACEGRSRVCALAFLVYPLCNVSLCASFSVD